MATILIVDDLADNRKYLVTVLRQEGHELLEAADGSQGLAIARAKHPDLVITDVLMPVMDGYEFVRRLRRDPKTRKIPVVFYTAHYGAREARELAHASGVSHVLAKPAESEGVLRIVDRVLSGELELPSPDATPQQEVDREHLRLIANKLSEKTGDLRTANARLRALINIGLELASEQDPERLLKSVCLAARDLFGASYVTLGILELKDRTVQRFVTVGEHVEDWVKTGDPVSGILGTVVAERRALRGENPGGDPATLQLPALHPTVQAFLAAPLVSPAHVYGWFCLVGNDGRVFSEDDEHLVTALAGQIGRIYESSSLATAALTRARELEHEILERKQAESEARAARDRANAAVEAHRTAEERMRFALRSANVGIWDMDCSHGVVRWSEILEAQYGLQPGAFAGTFEAFAERIHPDDRESALESIAKAMKGGTDFLVMHRTLWPDGTVRWLSGAGRFHLDENGEPLRGVGISMDVTERRSLEEQYHQAQKMEAIGRLAGGVAHDFNNLLTAILGYCELLLPEFDRNDPRHTDIVEIQKAGTSAAGLTRQLLAFSRKEIIEPILLDVNTVVSNLRPMLGRLLGEDLQVVLALRPGVALVKADRGQMEQIVVNLAVNARDAMPNGGTLTIETANVELDAQYAATHFSVRAGPHVMLTVTDTGTGMTPEVQARLFEPFFTTKDPGKGTGLGLATVHSIVTRSGGSVKVYSELARGTSFKMYFPAADGTEGTVQAPTPQSVRAVGAQTVLVVEDAGELRELTKRLLERQGYTVLVAANADEALRLFERGACVDLLLTDVVMPGASGPELTRRLADRYPALKVVYMSGYTDDAIVQHGILNAGIAFLQKPFTSETLGRKIREALDR